MNDILKKYNIARNLLKESCKIELSGSDDYKDDLSHSLKIGVYDQKFVVTMIQIILKKIEDLKFQPQDLAITLKTSLRKLIAMIEVNSLEKSNFVHIYCPKCEKTSLRYANDENWSCDCNVNQ